MQRTVTAVYAATILLSAALLFLVELMIGKMLLPVFGGAPAVWITCMVFFQAALLAGYAMAHAGSRYLGARRHAALHLVLVALPLAMLPLAIDARAPWLRDLPPALAVVALLVGSVGLPFLVLSTTSPLLQRWFADARRDADPYALYAASNLGSLIGLAAYPAIIEPAIGLSQQAAVWSAGYIALALLLLTSALLLWRSRAETPIPDSTAAPPEEAPALRRRLRWLALAAVPSSHMLGVTSYLTTDIAPIPLLWVIPLALYLLTFVFVFSPKSPIPHRVAVRALPFFAAVAALLLFAEANRPLWLVVPVHLGAFFFGAMVCHGELARDRPSPARLTEFYLWLSAGGVAGGLFNAVVAPLAFNGLAEYPLILVAVCLLRRVEGAPPFHRVRDLGWPIGIGAATLALVLLWESLGYEPDRVSIFVLFCVPILLTYRNLRFPIRFALCLAAIFAAASFYSGTHGTPILAQRSFFGALRVTLDRDGLHRLVHGGTVHGRQHSGELLAREPIDYFARTGPVGQVYDLVSADRPEGAIAVVGLGVGEVAAYALPAQTWTFYEIDPLVARIATDPRYFTYLRDAFPDPARHSIRLGDARLEMESAPAGGYDLIVLDAFSSDAIPMHLITREALALYVSKLAPDGVLAFHVSNNFVDLEPVLGNLAANAKLDALAREDSALTSADRALGKLPSRWVAMSPDASRLEPLRASNWRPAPRSASLGIWTDDHSNLLRVLRFLN